MGAMKIILRSDLENLGKLGDVVSVKPGFGRNYLIPQGLAMLATPSNLKSFELERKKLQAKMDSLRSAAAILADKIAGAEVSIVVRVGEGDKLYGSVTSVMIAEALARKGIEVDRKKIDMEEPIRTLGVHEVEVKLHAEVRGKVRVLVCRQGDTTAQADTESAKSAEPAQA
jgi:large subunit ribosomal protein L9